jgi:hypothetical protein
MKLLMLIFSLIFFTFLVVTSTRGSNNGTFVKIPIKIFLNNENEIWKLPLVSPELDIVHRREKKNFIEAYATPNVLHEIKKAFVVEELQWAVNPAQRVGYTETAALQTFLEQIHADYRHLTRLDIIGRSVKGLPIWALEISNHPGVIEAKPYVKYVANQHGNEPVGRELLIRLVNELLRNYTHSPRIRQLVDSTHIFIVPCMNPDGFDAGRRENAAGRDLNRDFPDQFIDPRDDPTGRQIETQAIMNWTRRYPFVLSGNLHEGDVVVNYPYDGTPDGRWTYSKAPDDALLRYLARVYASQNPDMNASRRFVGGITNGAQWYALYGGMQDWNYVFCGIVELTIELSTTQWPPVSNLPYLWETNRESLISFMEASHIGVRGVVTDSLTGQIVEGARLRLLAPYNTSFVTYAHNKTGYFHRLLIAGDYEIVCEAPGYRSRNIALSLPAWREPLNLSSTEHYLFLPIRLDPLTHPSTVAVDILRVDLQIFVVGFISLLIVFGLIFLLLAKLWRKNSKRAIAYTLSEVESNV